jgi:multidrug resistance efflux pump
MTDMQQRKEEMEKEIEQLKHQLYQQTQTIKDLKSTLLSNENKLIQFSKTLAVYKDLQKEQ